MLCIQTSVVLARLLRLNWIGLLVVMYSECTTYMNMLYRILIHGIGGVNVKSRILCKRVIEQKS